MQKRHTKYSIRRSMTRLSKFPAIAIALLVALATAVTNGQDSSGHSISFDRQIRPILANNCFTCHGPDESTREAGVRLDTREGALSDLNGYAPVVPGDAEDSELWLRITNDDDGLRMPPPESGKSLTADEIDLIQRWIEAGAEYDGHWSFEPIKRSEVPQVVNDDWSANPIDRFVMQRLRLSNLSPAVEADRPTLIRRLYLDLLGLLPSPAEVRAFEMDNEPGAYERLVDRLLANPHFGERWGRHWLDQARYADSHGYTNDNARVMWPYRDWVIESFNADQPFDEFTIDQLAGDLRDAPTRQQLVATGFHRNTLINNEGGTKQEQFRVEQAKDRIDTTGLVWLGLTVGCAKCHTHKFDPISHHEYYSLYAFFNSTVDANSVGPTISIPTPAQEIEMDRLREELAAAREAFEQQIDASDDQRQAWEQELVDRQTEPVEWTPVEGDARSRHGAAFETLDDRSFLVSGPNLPDDEYRVVIQVDEDIRALRLEALTDESLPQNGPGRASNGNIVLSDVHIQIEDRRHNFTRAYADHSQPNFDVGGALDGLPDTGWAINGSPEGGPNHNRVAMFTLPELISIDQPSECEVVLRFHNGASPYNLGRFRLSVSPTAPLDPSHAALVELAAIEPDARTADQTNQLDSAFIAEHEELARLDQQVKRIAAMLDSISRSIPTSMIMRETDRPRESTVHQRGDFLRPGDPVEPDVPVFLPNLRLEVKVAADDLQVVERDASSSFVDTLPNRFDLSRWIVRPDHPLTARVRVNRIWMRLFGRGLVVTEDDFGTQGARPSHPELLDWLASEFQEQSWSTKEILRTIVTSQTYRQSSMFRIEVHAVDPDNAWLARQNRLRVEAEVVRDLALVASGMLADQLGGPSVYPPQPDGVYAFTQVAKSWPTSQGTQRFRRGMYTFFYRSAPHPLLSTFDVPRFNQSCTRRDRSNTPLQSLTLANDPAVIELAVAFASRILRLEPDRPIGETDRRNHEAENAPAEPLPDSFGGSERDDDSWRMEQAFRLAYSRAPSDREAARLIGFLHAERDRWNASRDSIDSFVGSSLSNVGISFAGQDEKHAFDHEQMVEFASWVSVARLLFNLDGFVTRE